MFMNGEERTATVAYTGDVKLMEPLQWWSSSWTLKSWIGTFDNRLELKQSTPRCLTLTRVACSRSSGKQLHWESVNSSRHAPLEMQSSDTNMEFVVAHYKSAKNCSMTTIESALKILTNKMDDQEPPPTPNNLHGKIWQFVFCGLTSSTLTTEIAEPWSDLKAR